MAKLYGQRSLLELTFPSFEPMPGTAATSSYGISYGMSVRLVNQLHCVGFGRVALPAHDRIDLVSPDVAAGKIKKAMTFAMDQKEGRFAEGGEGIKRASLSPL